MQLGYIEKGGLVMSGYLPYIYSAMWFVIGVALFYTGKKNNYGVITVISGIMFLFMGVWWLIDAAIPGVDLLSGTYRIILCSVLIVFVAIIAVFYIKYRKKHR